MSRAERWRSDLRLGMIVWRSIAGRKLRGQPPKTAGGSLPISLTRTSMGCGRPRLGRPSRSTGPSCPARAETRDRRATVSFATGMTSHSPIPRAARRSSEIVADLPLVVSSIRGDWRGHDRRSVCEACRCRPREAGIARRLEGSVGASAGEKPGFGFGERSRSVSSKHRHRGLRETAPLSYGALAMGLRSRVTGVSFGVFVVVHTKDPGDPTQDRWASTPLVRDINAGRPNHV
ncbi:MAG: hypothetical protein JWM85_3160 [Acidimicrobiaceae bacterium]|nr:hypothetical protein [Acidimicrobiaceae bacterium]